MITLSPDEIALLKSLLVALIQRNGQTRKRILAKPAAVQQLQFD